MKNREFKKMWKRTGEVKSGGTSAFGEAAILIPEYTRNDIMPLTKTDVIN